MDNHRYACHPSVAYHEKIKICNTIWTKTEDNVSRLIVNETVESFGPEPQQVDNEGACLLSNNLNVWCAEVFSGINWNILDQNVKHSKAMTSLSKNKFVERLALHIPLTSLEFRGSSISHMVSGTGVDSLTTALTDTLGCTLPLGRLKLDRTSASMQVTVIRASQESVTILNHHGIFLQNYNEKTSQPNDCTSEWRKLKNKRHLTIQANMSASRQRDDNQRYVLWQIKQNWAKLYRKGKV